MSWINSLVHSWRVVALVLLLVALIGPWVFEMIMVPAQYKCSAPYVRLEGDMCGEPKSGLWIFLYLGGGLMTMIWGVISGTSDYNDWLREAAFILLILSTLVLPVASTLLNLKKATRRRRVFNLAVWGWASVWALLIMLDRLHWALWGLWLFIFLAAGVLIIDGIALLKRQNPVVNNVNSG